MAYITPEEIAEELRVNLKAVYTWLRKGEIRGIKVGKVWRVRRVDYDLFLEMHANIPSSSTDDNHRVENITQPTKGAGKVSKQPVSTNVKISHRKKQKGRGDPRGVKE